MAAGYSHPSEEATEESIKASVVANMNDEKNPNGLKETANDNNTNEAMDTPPPSSGTKGERQQIQGECVLAMAIAFPSSMERTS